MSFVFLASLCLKQRCHVVERKRLFDNAVVDPRDRRDLLHGAYVSCVEAGLTKAFEPSRARQLHPHLLLLWRPFRNNTLFHVLHQPALLRPIIRQKCIGLDVRCNHHRNALLSLRVQLRRPHPYRRLRERHRQLIIL